MGYLFPHYPYPCPYLYPYPYSLLLLATHYLLGRDADVLSVQR